MSNVPNGSLAQKLTCRRRTVLGALAAGGGMSAFGATASDEHDGQDSNEGLVHQPAGTSSASGSSET